jgi:hypothetical protein
MQKYSYLLVQPLVIIIKSGTPYWTPEDCNSANPNENITRNMQTLPFSSKEKEIMSLLRTNQNTLKQNENIKKVVSNSDIIAKLPFLSVKKGSDLSILYPDCGVIAQVCNYITMYWLQSHTIILL